MALPPDVFGVLGLVVDELVSELVSVGELDSAVDDVAVNAPDENVDD